MLADWTEIMRVLCGCMHRYICTRNILDSAPTTPSVGMNPPYNAVTIFQTICVTGLAILYCKRHPSINARESQRSPHLALFQKKDESF